MRFYLNFYRNFERYYFDMLQTNLRLDYKMALELTSGILVLELVHRVFVCVFEVSRNNLFIIIK